MSAKKKDFFRVEYHKQKDNDGDDCVVPTVWFGVQGFDLVRQYGEDSETAQAHAEWFVSMFQKAIDSYANHRTEKLLEGMEEDYSIYDEAEKYSDEIAQGFIKGVDFALEEIRKRLNEN